MKELLNLVKNIKAGPRTSVVGGILGIFGAYLIYTSEEALDWMSIEVGLLLIGTYLCLSSDSILKSDDED